MLRHIRNTQRSKHDSASLSDVLSLLHSYFPVFPPPPGSLLDTALGAKQLRLPATPDVLLLPSDLAAFAKLLPVPDGKVGGSRFRKDPGHSR